MKDAMEGFSGAVLVGGKSHRMGMDKPLLTIGDRPLIERIVETLWEVVDEVLLVGGDAVRFGWLGVPALDDLVPGGGPLAGIHTALSAARHPRCLVVACDMPFLNTDLLYYMLEEAAGWDAVVPRPRGRLEPLHAIYAQSCLEPVERMLASGNLCPLDLYPLVRVRYVETYEVDMFEGGWLSFVNLNTPADLTLAQALEGSSLQVGAKEKERELAVAGGW